MGISALAEPFLGEEAETFRTLAVSLFLEKEVNFGQNALSWRGE